MGPPPLMVRAFPADEGRLRRGSGKVGTRKRRVRGSRGSRGGARRVDAEGSRARKSDLSGGSPSWRRNPRPEIPTGRRARRRNARRAGERKRVWVGRTLVALPVRARAARGVRRARLNAREDASRSPLGPNAKGETGKFKLPQHGSRTVLVRPAGTVSWRRAIPRSTFVTRIRGESQGPRRPHRANSHGKRESDWRVGFRGLPGGRSDILPFRKRRDTRVCRTSSGRGCRR